MDSEAKSLNLDEAGKLVAALSMGGVVSYVAGEDGLQIKFYDLNLGKHTAAVTIMGAEDPQMWNSDGQYLWFVAYEQDRQVLTAGSRENHRCRMRRSIPGLCIPPKLRIRLALPHCSNGSIP
jgi:hypothetical protein